MKTIFSQSVPGRTACLPPMPEERAERFLPKELMRAKRPALPEVSELDVVRHFTKLSTFNYSVDSNFYPLGSCTMKYNPKFTEYIAALPGYTMPHPALSQLPKGAQYTQGCLQTMYEAEEMLCELTGMEAFTSQPMAGANGELTGALLIAAYHKHKGNKKTKIICPDAAHGTNPASAVLAGFEVVNIESKDGIVDPEALEAVLDDSVAAVMMTCPNTLGLFESHLPTIVEKLRKVDALLYYDGANFNAIMGKMRIGDVGFDVVHLNVHKTLATPHGGGGPGAGPVGVSARLVPYLPTHRPAKAADGTYYLDTDLPESIGHVSPFYGSFSVMLKAFVYMVCLGGEGLTQATERAVLNANYMRKRLENHLHIPYNRICMHEFVASASKLQDECGVRALDLAKGLLEKGHHAPTIYFPLIVKECLMFEPTETESKETLDGFLDDLIDLIETAKKDPEALFSAPHNTPVRRLDETKAAREMVLVDEV